MTRQRLAIDALENHPNLGEIVGVLAQLAQIRDEDLPVLARSWSDQAPGVREARATALAPDSPLVLEVLAAFEALEALFAEDLRGEAAYLQVPPAVVGTALKAVRDAIAAAYARPVLSRAGHAALMAPWRAVYPTAGRAEPDLGPRSAQVKELLAMLPLLAARCHDADGARLYEALGYRALAQQDERAAASQTAYDAAVLTSRRRVWTLVRRTAAEALGRACPQCRRAGAEPADPRVATLCLDAACALVVADALGEQTATLLTDSVLSLVPAQRAGE